MADFKAPDHVGPYYRYRARRVISTRDSVLPKNGDEMLTNVLLVPDLQRATLDALLQVSAQLTPNGTAESIAVAYPPEDSWLTSRWPLVINMLWALALILGLVTAVFAMLLKRGLIRFNEERSTAFEDDDTGVRQLSLALRRVVNSITTLLPLSIHIAIALFLIGLIPFTWHANIALGLLVTVTVAIGVSFYGGITLLPRVFQYIQITALFRRTIPLPADAEHAVTPICIKWWRRLFLARQPPWRPWQQYESMPLFHCGTGRELSWVELWMGLLGGVARSGDLERGVNPEERFVLDLKSELWPLSEEIIVSLVGWRAPAEIGRTTARALQSQLSSRSFAAIRILLSQVVRAGATRGSDVPVKDLVTLAKLSSVPGERRFALDDEVRQVLLSWVADRGDNGLPAASSLLLCAFLLFAAGSPAQARSHFTADRYSAEWVTVYIVALENLSLAAFPDDAEDFLVGSCLVLEYLQRYDSGTSWYSAHRLAQTVRSAQNIPDRWLASFLPLVSRIQEDNEARGRRGSSAQENVTRRFRRTDSTPGEQLAGILRTAAANRILQEDHLALFHSLLLYTAKNASTFTEVKAKLLAALRALLPANPVTPADDALLYRERIEEGKLPAILQRVINILDGNPAPGNQGEHGPQEQQDAGQGADEAEPGLQGVGEGANGPAEPHNEVVDEIDGQAAPQPQRIVEGADGPVVPLPQAVSGPANDQHGTPNM
ncbi:hypothetical protein CALVIDRAFT_555224 [Calocera viscosa TUFC12733]|uniref:DUF6535 domain-containing protein n=1 Tax=Calocera viscosa (strain TUFC12733) TaxID=1330018 RepID=A0A167LWD4_CALVF|nr:hypothetical protein CALVIDRAFT_555224 [Calocera viscosa TUFC12733]